MSELLCYADAYLKVFEAEVLASEDQGVVLDRTAFYPGGGGQPSDVGWLRFEGAELRVGAVRKSETGAWHHLEGGTFPAGARVSGEIDWARRYALMRTHTALHILCGVVWRDYGASVTGGNMEPLHARMDFEFEHMHQDLVREIEMRVNAEVAAARPVSSRSLPRAEAFAIPDLIRTKINLLPAGIEQVRVVEIQGLDLQADGGTHVANTSEVGRVNVVDYKSKGAINKRIVIQLSD